MTNIPLSLIFESIPGKRLLQFSRSAVKPGGLSKVMAVCGLLTAFALGPCSANGNVIKDGQKIAFLGDYATTWTDTSYPHLVIQGLEANGIKAVLIPVWGAKSSDDMLAHLDEKVSAMNPDWLVISSGVSSAWANRSADQYQQDIAQIIDKAQAANIQVVLSTGIMADENPTGRYAKLIADYVACLRQLAHDKKCLVTDTDLPATIAAAGGGAQSKRGNILTTDGAFLNALGTDLVTVGILKSLGLNPDQLKKARGTWLTSRDFCEAKAYLTIRQYEKLDALAARQHCPASEVLGEMVAKALATRPKQ